MIFLKKIPKGTKFRFARSVLIFQVFFSMIFVPASAQRFEVLLSDAFSDKKELIFDSAASEKSFYKNSLISSSSVLDVYPFLQKKYPTLSEIFSAPKMTVSGFFTPKAYSYDELAFFCKVEVQIEKAARIPFKFRLGDVQYVDYLEQKTDLPK